MESLILVGISGSGKSTYTKEKVKSDSSIVSINRDSLRLSLFTTLEGYYTHPKLQERERFITQIVESLIYKCQHYKYHPIIDATNLKTQYLNDLYQNLSAISNVHFKLFDISLQEAKRRVLCRDYGYFPASDGDLNYVTKNDLEYTMDECSEVDYITQQFEQYKLMKEHLQKYYNPFSIW